MPQCDEGATPEGLLCRRHWNRVPGALKAHYQSARKSCITAAWSSEYLRKGDDE